MLRKMRLKYKGKEKRREKEKVHQKNLKKCNKS